MTEQINIQRAQADVGLAVALAATARASTFRAEDRLRKQAEWRTRNRMQLNRYAAAWTRAHPRPRWDHVLDLLKQRARKRGWAPPDFDAPFLAALFTEQNGRCACCGDGMDPPTIDRTDNTKPYVRANIAFLCMPCNRIKNTGSAGEHERIAKWMRSRGVA